MACHDLPCPWPATLGQQFRGGGSSLHFRIHFPSLPLSLPANSKGSDSLNLHNAPEHNQRKLFLASENECHKAIKIISTCTSCDRPPAHTLYIVFFTTKRTRTANIRWANAVASPEVLQPRACVEADSSITAVNQPACLMSAPCDAPRA